VSEIKHRTVETNGIHMHIAESGQGPWWCCVTVFPNHGIRGAISCRRSHIPARPQESSSASAGN